MFSKSIHILAWIGTLFLSMSELCPMVWICYILVSPNVGGHLGCFHVLSIWNTSLWTFSTFLCWHIFTFLVCISLRVEWVGHMVTQYITFWGIAKLFSKRWQHFSFPSCQLLRILIAPHPHLYLLLIVCLWDLAVLVGVDVVSHCDFDLHNQL